MFVYWPHGNLPPYLFPRYFVPEGHFPPNPLSRVCNEYYLFPLIVRLKSLFASGLTDESDTQESILKKITYALEQESCCTQEEISGLTHLMNADACPPPFFVHLVKMVFGDVLSSWSTNKQRVVIRSIAFLWHMKGTHLSWYAYLRLYGKDQWTLYELYKNRIYEFFDYSLFKDYTHQLRAARVLFADADDPANIEATPDEAREYMEVVDRVKPIHVLYRPYPTNIIEIGNLLDSVTDSFAMTPANSFTDTPSDLSDTVTVTPTCVHWCQSSCQSASEWVCNVGCETGCETGCEIGCQTGCEATCEGACEVGCEVSCEAECTAGCEIGCQLGCQISCETGSE